MNKYMKLFVSLFVGLLGFVAVGVAVTELLDPYIWPSLMLGLPIGLVAGIAFIPLAYLGITYWEERQTTGTASEETVRRLWTTVAALFGFLAGGGVAVAILASQAMGLASAILLAGFPVGIVSGALVGYLVYRRDWTRQDPPAASVQ